MAEVKLIIKIIVSIIVTLLSWVIALSVAASSHSISERARITCLLTALILTLASIIYIFGSIKKYQLGLTKIYLRGEPFYWKYVQNNSSSKNASELIEISIVHYPKGPKLIAYLDPNKRDMIERELNEQISKAVDLGWNYKNGNRNSYLKNGELSII